MPINDFKKLFGASVRGWRNQLGLSQEQLAERANLHRTYISDVERGFRNISLENIQRLARALDVSVCALFPLAGSSESTSETGSQGPAAKFDGRLVEVLLVEDNPDDVELTLHAFEKARFANRVRVVSDGQEALDYIFCEGNHAGRDAEKGPDVILLDLDLPKVGGTEVLKRIKTDQRTRALPVLVLTISDDSFDIAECRQLGAENYIVKPVNFQRLSQATPGLNLQWGLFESSGRE